MSVAGNLGAKSVLPALLVLVLVAAASQASVLQVYLTADTVTAANVDFNVQMWARVVADPAIPGENLTDMGITDLSVTIYSDDTTGKLAPRPSSLVRPDQVKVTFNSAVFDNNCVSPARMTWASEPGGADSDLDALGCVAATSGADLNVGVGSPVLIGTQVWRFSSYTRAYLGCDVHTGSRHWNLQTFPPYKETFTAVQGTGVYVGSYSYSLAGPTRVAAGYTGTWTVTGDNSNPVNVTMDWDDLSNQAQSAQLPATFTHSYSQAGTYTLAASITDSVGTSIRALDVSVVDNPDILTISIDGSTVALGSVVSLPAHTLVTLTATASGAVDAWSFVANGVQIGAGAGNVFTWTGYSEELLGDNTLSASNTALGSSVDLVEFEVVPEPATLSLLLLGAAGVLRRRQ